MTIDYYFGRFSPFLCLLEFDDLKRGALAKPRFQTHTHKHPSNSGSRGGPWLPTIVLQLLSIMSVPKENSGFESTIWVASEVWWQKGGHAKSYFQTERAKNFVQVLAQKFKALGKRVTNQMRRQILTPFMAFDDHFRWAFAKLMMIEQKFHTSMPHT